MEICKKWNAEFLSIIEYIEWISLHKHSLSCLDKEHSCLFKTLRCMCLFMGIATISSQFLLWKWNLQQNHISLALIEGFFPWQSWLAVSKGSFLTAHHMLKEVPVGCHKVGLTTNDSYLFGLRIYAACHPSISTDGEGVYGWVREYFKNIKVEKQRWMIQWIPRAHGCANVNPTPAMLQWRSR